MNPVSSGAGGISAIPLIASARSYLDEGRHKAAVGACEQALQKDPGSAHALLLLGIISFELDQPAQALTFLGRAHAARPDVKDYADALAVVNTRIGHVNEGLFFAKLATTLQSDPVLEQIVPSRYSNFFVSVEQSQPNRFRGRAEFLLAHGHTAETIVACEKQLELTPGDIETMRILASALRQEGETSRAISIGHELLAIESPQGQDALELARSLADAGMFDEAVSVYDFIAACWGEDPSIESERLGVEIRDPLATRASIDHRHDGWITKHSRPVRWDTAPLNDKNSTRALRIGYLCTSFGGGGLIDLMAPVICQHANQGHAAYIYADGPGSDATSEHIRRFVKKWTDIHDIDNETVAEILHGDAIDVAVDLTTHGIGNQRLALARHSTPVSFGWSADPVPADTAIKQRLICGGMTGGTDETARLNILAPYSPPTTAPEVKELPAQQLGYITFGAKLDLISIGQNTASLWSALLMAVPNSQLLIASCTNRDIDCVKRCISRFNHFGMRERVNIVNMAENFADELEFYHYVDVALDGYPVSQLPELYHALWMGVPVLSKAGRDGGLGAATLVHFGAAEWTATDTWAFVKAGRDLCADPAHLSRLRATLRERMQASALTDVRGFTQELESIYASAWSDWCRQAHH